jgi:peptide/nickel transport system substrate-binding protein
MSSRRKKMKNFLSKSAISKIYAAIIAIIVIVAIIAGAWYYTGLPGPSPSQSSSVSPSPSASPSVRLLRIGYAWPLYADPAIATDECGSTAISNLYDPLVWPVPNAEPKAWVAQNWTTSTDGLVYTFTIRSGIKFHSGNNLTADDVVFSMKRLMAIGQGFNYLFSPYVDKVEKVAADQVRFTLKKTFGPFLMVLVRLYIVDTATIVAHENMAAKQNYTIDGTNHGDLSTEWLTVHDAGSGAYKIVDAVMEQWFEFGLVSNYWAPVNANAPTLVTMEWTSGNPATEKTSMLNRELEVTDAWLPAETLDSLATDPHITKISWLDPSEYYYMLNTQKPPLDDIHVRKALAYCLNYSEMMSEIYSRYILSTSCVPAGLPGYANTQIYYYNVTKAQEELQLSKYYPDILTNASLAIEFHWIQEVPERERDALLFASNALAIGLHVNVVKTPWTKTVEEMTNAQLSAHIYNILVAPHFPEAGSLLDSRYHTAPLSWESNEKLYNTTLDLEIEDALSTINVTERYAKYVHIQQEIMAICPSLFIYDYKDTMCAQDYVKIPAVENPQLTMGILGYDRIYRDWQILPH